jgi:hypothetical protein
MMLPPLPYAAVPVMTDTMPELPNTPAFALEIITDPEELPSLPPLDTVTAPLALAIPETVAVRNTMSPPAPTLLDPTLTLIDPPLPPAATPLPNTK